MTDTNGATGELGIAIQELEDALRRATEATVRVKAALPQIERMSSVFGELESIITGGRGAQATPPTPALGNDAPSVRVPRAPRTKQAPPSIIEPPAASIIEPPSAPIAPAPIAQPPTVASMVEAVAQIEAASDDGEESIETIAAIGAHGDKLVSFRLEVDSQPGPLDLRAVDDAISSHEAVRDVALIDYDGRRATLKVWIAPPAVPAEVQRALSERAVNIASDGNHVSIVALEDVA